MLCKYTPKLGTFKVFACAILSFLFISSVAQAGVPRSQDACKRLSEGAKISKTKVLILGYEGLFSSGPINANLLSAYREKLATGKKAMRPIYAFGGSFLVRGPLTRIVENYKNKVQVLVYGRTGQTHAESIPGKCATLWMQDTGAGTEGRKVIIVGHSFGGGAAWELANALQKKNVKVDSVVTADPRSPKQCMGECWSWAKPANVSYWFNYYQKMPLRGHVVPGAYNNYQGGYSHGTIQNAPGLYQSIANRIDGVSAPLTTAPSSFAENTKAGREGALDMSQISGLNKPPEAEQKTAAAANDSGAAQTVPSNAFLAAAANRSPARSAREEKAWMDRASGYEYSASGGSAMANRVEGPGNHVVMKAGPMPVSRRVSSTGASLPGQGTDGPEYGGATDAGSAKLGNNSTSDSLNKMWPLSKADSPAHGSGGAGGGFAGTGGGSSRGYDPGPISAGSASTANDFGGDPMKDQFGGSSLGAGNDADAVSGEAAEIRATAAVMSLPNTSLFKRVHLKHEYWYKRRDRF